MGWNADVFNNFVKLNRGFDLPEKNIIHGEYPVVASTSVKDYHKDYKVNPPCVVTGRSGSLGSVQFISAKCWPLNTTLYVKDFKGNIPKFVYYFLKEMHLDNFNSGAGVPTLNQNHLHKLKIKIPDPPLQKKIAAVLSAYDDLIENNNRRIAILEKMAEELYREWFVRLRFPGHEKTKFRKGIPDGWEIVKLGDLINMKMGQSPPSEFYNSSGDGLPFNQGVGTYGHRFPRKAMFCSCNGRIANQGDILFSVRAPVGRLNIADCKMIIGRGLAALTHKAGYNSFLFYLLKTIFASEDIIGNGAIFNSVGKDELYAFKILQPNSSLDKQFNDNVRTLDKEIEFLLKAVEKLITSRDRLLSRLMTGKLDVENLDIRFPKSMEEGIA